MERHESRKLRILLTEDSRGDVLLVREALTVHAIPYDLEVKTDGREFLLAVESMEAGQMPCPDLILLDLNLPRHNGLELLERVRSSSVCGNIPVIVVTSSGAAKDRASVERLGATAYFRKPYDYDEFMELGGLVRRVAGLDERPS